MKMKVAYSGSGKAYVDGIDTLGPISHFIDIRLGGGVGDGLGRTQRISRAVQLEKSTSSLDIGEFYSLLEPFQPQIFFRWPCTSCVGHPCFLSFSTSISRISA